MPYKLFLVALRQGKVGIDHRKNPYAENGYEFVIWCMKYHISDKISQLVIFLVVHASRLISYIINNTS